MKLELTPRGLLVTLFRQRIRILLVFLVIMGLGMSYIIYAKPMYHTAGRLLVKFGENAMPDVAMRDKAPVELSVNDRSETMQSNTEILRSHDLLQTVVLEFGPERIYPGITKRVEGRDTPVEATIKTLLKNHLNVKFSQQSNIIEVHMLNSNPEVAAQFVKRLLELFIRRQTEVYNMPQTSFLEEQAAKAKAGLEESQKALYDFKAKAGISDIEEELTQLLKEKGEAATIAFESVDEAQRILSELRAKEAEMLTTYRSSSPQVKRLRQSINEAEKQLRVRMADLKERGAAPGNSDELIDGISEPKTATGMLASQTANIDKRINELEEQRTHYNDLVRQVQIDAESYKNYQVRAEEARANETLNQQNITRISVVDEPVVPMKPAQPRKMLILGVCLLGGIIFALGTGIVIEILDERFSTPEQVYVTLQLPVMATFNEKPQEAAT